MTEPRLQPQRPPGTPWPPSSGAAFPSGAREPVPTDTTSHPLAVPASVARSGWVAIGPGCYARAVLPTDD